MTKKTKTSSHRSLTFELAIERHWPPVNVECLPFAVRPRGLELLAAPVFVKGLSVGDVIAARERRGYVTSWKHLRRSKHSTIWLLELARGARRAITGAFRRLEALGCSGSSPDQLTVHVLDVPPAVSLARVDAVLANLDPEKVAIAYPSLRHA